MKIIKSISILLVVLSLFSCEKHKIKFITTPVDETMAEFQLHYFEPVVATGANYIDSVYVNGTLYSSVKGSGQLLTYNGVPGGALGKFFTAKAGDVNFKLYRGGEVIYDQNVKLEAKKQNVFVYDLNSAPAVVSNGHPYFDIDRNENTPAAEWDTDSACKVKFVNMLFETATQPYAGKIQYQYKDFRTEEWMNIGEPIAFGEATEHEKITIVKLYHNSSGYRRVDYRALDENGDALQVWSGSYMKDYSDWWNGYIGRAYLHILCGVRTNSPVTSKGSVVTPSVKVWTNL